MARSRVSPHIGSRMVMSVLVIPDRAARTLGWLGVFVTLIAMASVVVYPARGGFVDRVDGSVSGLDTVYFAASFLSMQGQGDVVAVSGPARAVATGVVTPVRVLFLVAIVAAAVHWWWPVRREEAHGQGEAG